MDYLEIASQALAEYEAGKQADRTTQLSALATVKASNARMTTHRGQRIVAVPAANDTPALRQALAVLGYEVRVLHLDTHPLRGKGSEAVAAAISAMEEIAHE